MSRRLSRGDTVLVLRDDWSAPSKYIRWFPDDPCLDVGTDLNMLRSRLGNPVNLGAINDCRYGAPYQVTRCTVV